MVMGCGADGGGAGQPDAGLPDAGSGGAGGEGGTAASSGSGGAGGGGIAGSGGSGTGGTGAAGQFHLAGFEDPEAHGPSLKQGELDCRFCHGEDLTGGDRAPSCDACHTPTDPQAWRTDCVFCHGGVENQTGAPPRNLDGSSTSAGGTFPPHDAHVRTAITEALDCVECHIKPTDVLSVGHVFDYPPGVAEVDLGGGRSSLGTYDRSAGRCANLYCHGNGLGDNGTLASTDPPMTCESCHPGANSASMDLGQMSGLHGFHVSVGAGCQDCHQATTADGMTIVTPTLHINGQRDTQFAAPGFTYDEGEQSCSGTCHGYPHIARPWVGFGGSLHPPGFANPDVHGAAMELQRMDCRDCHADDLTGGLGPSCDSCHSPGWRTDCVFCHGGVDNLTGAPPRDLGALPMSGSYAFLAHTTHVTEGISRAYDCTECHVEPSNVLSMDHAFDDTPGAAEVDFSMGLGAVADYDGAGRCSNLYCHGNGRADNGVAVDGSPSLGCDSCHPGMESAGAWDTMSGEHRKHLEENLTCGNCHFDVTENGVTVRGPLLHVDGLNQVRFTDTGITYDQASGRCAGECHGERHESESW